MNKGSKCCRRYCKLEFKISTWLEQKKVWLRLTSYSLLESSFKCKWGQSWMTTPIKDLWKSLIFKRLSSSENFFEQHFFMLSPRRRRCGFSRAENLHVTQKQQHQKKWSLYIKESRTNLEDGFMKCIGKYLVHFCPSPSYLGWQVRSSKLCKFGISLTLLPQSSAKASLQRFPFR